MQIKSFLLSDWFQAPRGLENCEYHFAVGDFLGQYFHNAFSPLYNLPDIFFIIIMEKDTCRGVVYWTAVLCYHPYLIFLLFDIIIDSVKWMNEQDSDNADTQYNMITDYFVF